MLQGRVMIPRRLMCHRAVLRRYGRGADLSRSVLSEVTLTGIRVQIADNRRHGVGYKDERRHGVMYCDPVNTLPEDPVIYDGEVMTAIEWYGREYAVTGVRYVYDGERLHHMEYALGEMR